MPLYNIVRILFIDHSLAVKYVALLSVALIPIVLFSIHQIDFLWGDRNSVGFRAEFMEERQYQAIQVSDW